MSFQTIDNGIFESINSDETLQKPFNEKKYMFVTDNNPSSTYSTSQVQFTTEVLSNNGKYNAFNEGIVFLPTMIGVSSAANNVGLDRSDVFLGLKNSNFNLIDKINVEYNNTQMLQGVNNINQYLIFKQHTEMGIQDEELNGSFLGYAKDCSTSWGYSAAPSSEGDGLLNNTNFIDSNGRSYLDTNSSENAGLVKRIGYFTKRAVNGKESILGTDDNNILGNMNVIQNIDASNKVYYYNCFLRLRDIPFFAQLPLIRSGTIRITLTLNNNVSFNINKSTTGLVSVSNFVNNTSTTNPIMVASSYKTLRVTNGANGADAVLAANAVKAGGLSIIGTLATATTFSVKLALGQITLNNIVYSHQIKQCRLYVPHYLFNIEAERQYLQDKIKLINYLDIVHYSFTPASNQSFNQLITNGLSNMRRLIMVGMITSGNGGTGLPAQSSPFSSEPSTTSPFRLQNFNVYIGGVPIYETSTVQYDYEQFLLELNGSQGINSNLTQGLSSGRISLQDFNNNYHYIVVNLDRKVPENENTSQSLLVSGTVKCLKDVTFYCFIERYKQLKIDVENGSIIA